MVFLRGLPPGITTMLFLAGVSCRTVVLKHGVVKMQISAYIEEPKKIILQIKMSPTGLAVESLDSKFLFDESVRFLADKENQRYSGVWCAWVTSWCS